MLLTIGLILLIFALADLVGRINGPAKSTPACSGHDCWELQDKEGKDLGLICATCKKTPTMILDEHVPND